MVFELARGIGDGVEVIKFIFLCQDGTKAAGYVSRAGGRISYKCILSVSTWKGHDWFGHERIFEDAESIHGLLW